eukprot:scaffold30599_cov66-Phaeocystis_antarctica.AAC.2
MSRAYARCRAGVAKPPSWPRRRRGTPRHAGGEARWSPSNHSATASTPPPPPRSPPSAAPRCEAPSRARAARDLPYRAVAGCGQPCTPRQLLAAPRSRSTAARQGPPARCVEAGPDADSAD